MLAGRAVVGSEGASAGSWDYYLLAIVVVLAMALPNVALRRVAAFPVHTTFVTGNAATRRSATFRSEEHTSELQSLTNIVCRLLLEKKKRNDDDHVQR